MRQARLLERLALADGGAILRFEVGGAAALPGQWFVVQRGEAVAELPVWQGKDGVLELWAGPEALRFLIGESAPWRLDGPRGTVCEPDPGWKNSLLLADAAGLPAVLYAARRLVRPCRGRSLVLLALGSSPPFTPKPSGFLLPAMPAGVIAALPLLEDWGLPSRLLGERPGCYQGTPEALLTALEAAGEGWAGACVYGAPCFVERLGAWLEARAIAWCAARLAPFRKL